uniref:Uncharacterized protein n=1 Tax=Magallana gigas TaxID=29159 RepID=A0A8W8J7B5_MAGGI
MQSDVFNSAVNVQNEVIQPTNYSTDSVLNLHLSTDDSSFSPQSSHLDSAPCHTEEHIDAPLLSTLDSSASPTAASDRNDLNSTDHDRLSPPSLNMSFYIDPPSLIQIADTANGSNYDEEPPVLSPIHLRSIVRPPKKFTPSDYVRARKSVFPDGVRHNWSLRKLSRVAGPGSGVMMELRDVLRPISSRWINGYIEILATAIAGWYYIVGFKFKQ